MTLIFIANWNRCSFNWIIWSVSFWVAEVRSSSTFKDSNFLLLWSGIKAQDTHKTFHAAQERQVTAYVHTHTTLHLTTFFSLVIISFMNILLTSNKKIQWSGKSFISESCQLMFISEQQTRSLCSLAASSSNCLRSVLRALKLSSNSAIIFSSSLFFDLRFSMPLTSGAVVTINVHQTGKQNA